MFVIVCFCIMNTLCIKRVGDGVGGQGKANNDLNTLTHQRFAFILKTQIEDLRIRLSEDIQRHMEMISCTEDIRRKQHIIKAILGIKQSLEPFPHTSTRPYVPPNIPDLDQLDYVQDKEDVRKLCEFFRLIHFTLFEIRLKLGSVYEHLSVKLVPVEYLTAYAICLKQIKEFAIQLEEL